MPSFRGLPLLALLLALPVRGQDVVSGPEKGKKAPALRVFDATGPSKDKDVDYVAERKGKPTVYAFVRADKWDRPMARFLKTLDQAVPKVSEDAAVVVVWLTDDVKKAKEYLPVAQQSLQFAATALTCFTGKKDGPPAWSINGDAHLTVVVVHGGKIAATFGYRSVNETDAPAVRDALKKARTPK
jgi:hypothetical protein